MFKKFLQNCALIILSCTLAFFIAEIVLRIIHFSYPNFVKPDLNLGLSYIPNSEGWYTAEGKVYIKINSDGFRDQEHLINKAPNTFRIAVLGDSYAAAL